MQALQQGLQSRSQSQFLILYCLVISLIIMLLVQEVKFKQAFESKSRDHKLNIVGMFNKRAQVLFHHLSHFVRHFMHERSIWKLNDSFPNCEWVKKQISDFPCDYFNYIISNVSFLYDFLSFKVFSLCSHHIHSHATEHFFLYNFKLL